MLVPQPNMQGQNSLDGYKQVDSFRNDDEYEDEVEESYITLDLGSVDASLLPSSNTYRFVGLDTPTPYLQLAGTFFKGKHETLLGTELLFKEETDPANPSKRIVKHVASTENRVRFHEVELKPKKGPVGDDTPGEQSTEAGASEEQPTEAVGDSVVRKGKGKGGRGRGKEV